MSNVVVYLFWPATLLAVGKSFSGIGKTNVMASKDKKEFDIKENFVKQYFLGNNSLFLWLPPFFK